MMYVRPKTCQQPPQSTGPIRRQVTPSPWHNGGVSYHIRHCPAIDDNGENEAFDHSHEDSVVIAVGERRDVEPCALLVVVKAGGQIDGETPHRTYVHCKMAYPTGGVRLGY